MVDNIRCESEADLTKSFFKKLLLGGIDKGEDHEEPNVGRKYVAEGSSLGPAQNDYSLAHQPGHSSKGKEHHRLAEPPQAKGSYRDQAMADSAFNPRFLQLTPEQQYQDQGQPVLQTRAPQRQYTHPVESTGLALRGSGRSSTLENKKESKKGWWPPI